MNIIKGKEIIEDITRLPVDHKTFADSMNGCLEVLTPHKGPVRISLDEVKTAGLFGLGSHTADKSVQRVCRELQILDKEAKDWLLDKWLKE